MRVSSLLVVAATFFVAAVLALVAANASVSVIEERSEIGVRDRLDARGMTWAEVAADGLQVTLTGIAPTEAVRFQALTAAGSIVDAARVIDEMQVEATASIAPPRFSMEILRNDAGISVIGLIPADEDREALGRQFEELAKNATFSDLLESADYPVPDGWGDSISFALVALDQLPRAKVSVEAGFVSVTALADSRDEKAALERRLLRAAPPGLRVNLDIAAPRPVLTPFTLRFVKDDDGTRFDACSADSDDAQGRILQAAFAAGLTGSGRCTVGMGVPTPRWSEAAEKAILAVAELGGGSVTFSDADVALVAAEGTDQRLFDRVVGELENELPEVFALKAVLPKAADPDAGPPEFVATRSPEGLVQLRGRIADEASRDVARSFAQSLFGSDGVYNATRIDTGLPRGWGLRVLTGLEALGMLSNGAVVITPDLVKITGNTGDARASQNIAQLLAAKLGEAEQLDINVTYQEKLDPVAGLPSPDECEADINNVLASGKITFEPSSANIDASALGTMDRISEILKECGDLSLEIQGHTDSQGREEMNLQLSQARAQSVLNELRARRVLTSSFIAKGYGETQPIADNDTAEGREANRRIEFRLIRTAPTTPEQQSTLDSVAQNGTEGNEAEEDQPEEPASE